MDLSDLFRYDIKPVDNKRLKRLLLRKLGYQADELYKLTSIEKLAFKGAQVLNSVNPRLRNPTILIFAGDHGIASDVSVYLDEPQTEDSLLRFLHGSSEVNVFAKASNLDVKVIDMAVNHSFEGTLTYWLNHGSKFINRKQAYATKSFLSYPAITTSELHSSMQIGANIVDRERKTGCNIIGFGELGRGSKFSAWCVASTLLDKPISELLSGEEPRLLSILDKALKTHPKTHDVYTLLSIFGSYDLAAIVAGMLRAAHHNMLILVDGLFTSTAVLAASKIAPQILDYCIFSYESTDSVHKAVLKKLNAAPLMNLELPSSMATGISYTYPIFRNSMNIFTK